VIPTCHTKGSQIQTTLLELAKASEFGERQLFGIQLSLEEAIANAIKHGNKLNQSKFVRIECDISPTEVIFVIEDEGEGFDPAGVPDPTLPEYIEEPNGRGVFLMREMMTDVSWNDRGNCLTLKLRR
jgi:serine/threonine-protein kinase RsbW